jgi:DNA-binding response OmpR family regulator
MAGRILLVGGQDETAETLVSAGFDVRSVGADAARRANVDEFELVIVEGDGESNADICRSLRLRSAVPIVIIARPGGDTVRGLELGADDYVTRPYFHAELVSRVRAILRRRELDRESNAVTRRVGQLQLDLADQTLRVAGERVDVSPTEFRLLALLAADPGRVFSRRELMSGVSRRAGAWRDRTCDAHVKNLRRKIERNPARPERLVTVRGQGYALREV